MTKHCLQLLEESGDSEYIKNFEALLCPFGLSVATLSKDSIRHIEERIITDIHSAIHKKPSLSTIPLSGSFWKPSPHLSEGLWSTYLMRFRCQNAGLGNRSDSHKHYAPQDSKGRVVQYPLCSLGRNNEVHLLVECKLVESDHLAITTSNGESLRSILNNIELAYPAQSSVIMARLFLGQQDGLSRLDFVERGRILIKLLEAFFVKWDTCYSTSVPRPVL